MSVSYGVEFQNNGRKVLYSLRALSDQKERAHMQRRVLSTLATRFGSKVIGFHKNPGGVVALDAILENPNKFPSVVVDLEVSWMTSLIQSIVSYFS